MTPAKITLHLFFAARSPRAVVLRRGPSKTCRMILWDRSDDSFEDGQWLRHKVYPERCHLAPDGAHFLFFALDGRRGSYSALSRPPYFTALALFPVGDTWSGGGVFLDRRHFLVDGGHDTIGRAKGLSRVTYGAPDPKGCTTGLRLRSGARAPLDRAATRALLSRPLPSTEPALRERVRQASIPADHGVLADGPRLLRRTQDGETRVIRDFSDMSFAPLRAPYDWRPETPEPPGWHPLEEAR